jgi:hypothetical protein
LPVVRWLQVGAAATGIGVALLAAPGSAAADAGGGSSATNSSHGAVDRHAGPRAAGRTAAPASARAPSRGAQPAARAAAARSATIGRAEVSPSVGSVRSAPGRFSSTMPAADSIASTTGAARLGSGQPLQSISDAVQQFLSGAANRLAEVPSGPVTKLLEGSLYLVRRALFPASVGVVTKPIQVPLYFQTIDTDGKQKLGIYVSLGYGAPPQLFEFDTGAGGFYAAYATTSHAASPWWGSDVTTTTTPVHDEFDSGLTYSGYAATATVSLYSVGSSTPLVTSGKLTVGQMNVIMDKTGELVWTPAGSSAPPIDNAFYGDFGMAPTYGANGIDQVIAQLTFARGVKPGYLIHVDPVTGQAWMQIGLTSNDIHNSDGMYFPMLPDDKAGSSTFPNSGLHFYGEQLFNAAINIIDRNGTLLIDDPNVGITPDTGASTTLHNTNLSPDPGKYNSIIDWKDDSQTVGKLKTKMLFWLTGTTTGQTPVRYFQFVTTDDTDAGRVQVQNAAPSAGPTELYYLNTGISLFYTYDVVYYLGTRAGNGTLGLIPQGIQSS